MFKVLDIDSKRVLIWGEPVVTGSDIGGGGGAFSLFVDWEEEVLF